MKTSKAIIGQFFLISQTIQSNAMTKKFLIASALLGFWGIIMGVLLAQVFAGNLTTGNQGKFMVALSFHMIHVVALLAITFMNRFVARSYLNIIFYLFIFGIILFSGSLYLKSTEDLTNIIIGFMGYLTPLGGVALFGGWAVLLFTGVTYKHKKRAIHNS
jgi:uncharacterized membrane protein YgdD (TMEM256/DUF423 family)